MTSLFGYTLEKLEERMLLMGQKRYRARQLFGWIYGKRVLSFDEMSDVALSFRETLKKEFSLELPKIVRKQVSGDGTIKLLLALADGGEIETALLPYRYGSALCVSSELGCSMGCAFCASGLLKRKRKLETSELVGQALVMDALLTSEGRKPVSHVVVMGTGEPFDNYDSVMDFIRIMNDPKAFAIGARHITVSTCGIPAGIRRYADEGLQCNLAISLHAPNDELREKLMPIDRAYPLKVLMEAVRYYEKKSGRRVTFEYILLQGVNDDLKQAAELVALLKGSLSFVNLIPYNPVPELPFARSSNNRVHAFFDYLNAHGVMATIRKEFGTDIDAACGQLRARESLAS